MNIIDHISHLDHPYVIAEVGINHNGDPVLAREMIAAAAETGADCVKFQNFIADRYIISGARRAAYQDASGGGKSQHEIIKACEISAETTAEMKAYADHCGVHFMSTPFEVWSLRQLLELDLPAIKISSCNLTNFPFLRELSVSGRPVLLSTGMADLAEVLAAVQLFRDSGSPFMLFQCTSNYPSDPANANLRVISTYQNLFQVPVGFSDHTPGNTCAIAAVALGAVAVEKHFTLSRDLPGIDQKASIEPHELKELVSQLRVARSALGNPLKMRAPEEADTFAALRRSLVAARAIKAGEILSEDMIAVKRPGTGLPTSFLPFLLGMKASRPIDRDELISLSHFMA